MAADPLYNLLKALKTKWDATAALTSVFNGPHLHEKPPNISIGFPYVAITTSPSNLVLESCESQVWEHSISFYLYDDTDAKVGGHAGTVKTVFDSNSLSLTMVEGKFVSLRAGAVTYTQEDKKFKRVQLEYTIRTSNDRIA